MMYATSLRQSSAERMRHHEPATLDVVLDPLQQLAGTDQMLGVVIH